MIFGGHTHVQRALLNRDISEEPIPSRKGRYLRDLQCITSCLIFRVYRFSCTSDGSLSVSDRCVKYIPVPIGQAFEFSTFSKVPLPAVAKSFVHALDYTFDSVYICFCLTDILKAAPNTDPHEFRTIKGCFVFLTNGVICLTNPYSV